MIRVAATWIVVALILLLSVLPIARLVRLCRIEMPGEVQSEAYRQINPVGETPTLVTARASGSARAWRSSTI
jgi:glutathione S-transferase